MSAEDSISQRRTDGEMPYWSEDGKWIYFLRNEAGTRALWKVPADNGDPLKVRDVGAAMLLPSSDGKDFLFERAEALWRTGRNGGTPQKIADGIAHGMWTRVPGGACFLNYATASGFSVDCALFSRKEITSVASLGSWPRVYGPPGFASSPDGKWIFYGRVDQLESNIMLAEGLATASQTRSRL
jgi:hypothetical protein